MRLKLTVLIVFLQMVLAIKAQTGRYYNGDNQLSTALVTATYQDNNGMIWIATNNGLNTFDGYQFRIYSKENGNLASNIVNGFAQTKDGKMYIAFDNALQYLKHGRFENVKLENGDDVKGYFRYLCLTRKGEILTGASTRNGILKVSADGKAKWLYGKNNIINAPMKIIEARNGSLWMVTENKGVVTIHNGRIRQYFSNIALSNSMKDICTDKKGYIYVACQKGGVYVINSTQPNSKPQILNGTEKLAVISVLSKKDGTILLGTDGDGLYEYCPKSHTTQRTSAFSTELNLNKVKITNINEDNEGNIWLSMFQKGVFMIPAHKSAFHYQGYRLGNLNTIGEDCVSCVMQSHDGHIWVATDGDGLYSLNFDGSLLRHFSHPIVPTAILGMEEDHLHRIWIASYMNGGGWIDPISGSYHRLPFTNGKAQNVFDMWEDSNHNMWIATLGDGLKKLNLDNNKLTEYRSSAKTNNCLVNDYITHLNVSPNGRRLYVCTSTGLACLDMNTNSWVNTFGKNGILNELPINDAKEDKYGNIWICTNNGLYIYSLKTKELTKYTTSEGIADNNTASVVIDKNGKAWVSTLHGLSCIDIKSRCVENFYLCDGLQGNEFSWGVSYKSVIGGKETIFFGGMSGLTWFNSTRISHKCAKPDIFITGLTIGEDEVKPGEKSGIFTITDDDIDKSKVFDFSHQDNTFSISLSTLSYSNPERIRFAYSINGDEWIQLPQGKNTITLTHLQPDCYTFRVKAIVGGIESPIKKFYIEIHPAWYFSLPMKLLYIILIVFFIWWYMRQLRRKQQDQLRLQEHIHAQEMSESKLRFFMNISHEIRTPLTLIISPLEELMKTDYEPIRNSIYRTIHRNAMRLLSQVNQMMDLRKIDAGKMVMHMEPADMICIAKDIALLFEQQANVKSINFKLEHEEEVIPVNIDRQNFDKVLMNILSNAFKYTHTGGKITMAIKRTEENGKKWVNISVSDDGEKIPTDKLEKIFERFYQAVSVTNDRQAGTGIGLDLTRSLVELHGGRIWAENNIGKGCTFTIRIPAAEIDKESISANVPKPTKQEQKAEEKQEPRIQHIKATSNPLIVIAEDDAEIMDYLSKELGDTYRIIACSNGKIALNAILKHHPQLIISDIMMPEMDGNELCTRVRHNINTNDIPVILLTAKDREDDQLIGLEIGADAYITKPFNLDILKRTMINLINMRNVMKNKLKGGEEQKDKISEVEVKSPDSKLLQRVMAVINDNLTNEDLSVTLISKEVGISRVHLYRKMKELTNQTPHDFIRNIRLKQAANLLASGRHNITEVMNACGFSNSASFSTQFKKMYGMSPREYMKENI